MILHELHRTNLHELCLVPLLWSEATIQSVPHVGDCDFPRSRDQVGIVTLAYDVLGSLMIEACLDPYISLTVHFLVRDFSFSLSL